MKNRPASTKTATKKKPQKKVPVPKKPIKAVRTKTTSTDKPAESREEILARRRVLIAKRAALMWKD
jgi:hypothetical protein